MSYLDKKERVISFQLTELGKENVARGTLNLSYFAFVDDSVVYDSEKENKSSDAPQHEPYSLPRDSLAWENNKFNFLQKNNIQNGKIYLQNEKRFAKDDELSIYEDSIKEHTKNNITNSSILTTEEDSINEDDNLENFRLSKNEINFQVSKSNFKNLNILESPKIDSLDKVYQDKKFSQVGNFLYLPPEVQNEDGVTTQKLGNFPSINSDGIKSYQDLKPYLSILKKSNFIESIYIEEGSEDNNVLMQCLEIDSKELKLLDFIDIGELLDENNQVKRIVFLGKYYEDKNGNPYFLNIFTLEFE